MTGEHFFDGYSSGMLHNSPRRFHELVQPRSLSVKNWNGVNLLFIYLCMLNGARD